jgi:Tfp pilus assembly protein PilO
MENLVGFNKREKLLILAAALCVIILLGDKFILSPMLNLWKTRAARITALEESLNKGTVLTDREETLTQRWQEMQGRSLTNEASSAENQVLNRVNDWARSSGLNVTSLRPRWIIDEGQEARKLEFSLSATGSMESVTRFLYELERDPLAIRLEDVELATHDEQGREITLSARFTGLIVSEEKSS